MKKTKVAPGIFWVEIPEADLRIVCGCPADTVKHLAKHGMIVSTTRGGFTFETGPNAILLSDTPIQKGSFANLSEFPLLQMFYKQGMLIPGHPEQHRTQAAPHRAGRPGARAGGLLLPRQLRPELRGGDRGVRGPRRGRAGDVPSEEVVRLRHHPGHRGAGGDPGPGRRSGGARPGGCSCTARGSIATSSSRGGQSVQVDLTLGPGEEFEPSYKLPARGVRREHFSVIHVGEGDGWDPARPCMGSIVCHDGLLYLVDAGPHITFSLDALGIGAGDIEGIFHSHAHDDHFAGLTSLVRSERRMKYFAAPYVRATAQKKLAALMRFDEERFARFFDVHDLVPGEWNAVERHGGEAAVFPASGGDHGVLFPRPRRGGGAHVRSPCGHPFLRRAGKAGRGARGTGALTETAGTPLRGRRSRRST